MFRIEHAVGELQHELYMSAKLSGPNSALLVCCLDALQVQSCVFVGLLHYMLIHIYCTTIPWCLSLNFGTLFKKQRTNYITNDFMSFPTPVPYRTSTCIDGGPINDRLGTLTCSSFHDVSSDC